MAVTNEVNKKLNSDYLIGSIIPDIVKQIRDTKIKSHFIVD